MPSRFCREPTERRDGHATGIYQGHAAHSIAQSQPTKWDVSRGVTEAYCATGRDHQIVQKTLPSPGSQGPTVQGDGHAVVISQGEDFSPRIREVHWVGEGIEDVHISLTHAVGAWCEAARISEVRPPRSGEDLDAIRHRHGRVWGGTYALAGCCKEEDSKERCYATHGGFPGGWAMGANRGPAECGVFNEPGLRFPDVG